MTAPLRRVAMRRPGALLRADHQRWNFRMSIEAESAVREYEQFVAAVRASGTTIEWFPDDDDELADSVFTSDPSLVVPHGAVVLRPGKELRREEAALHAEFYRTAGIPLLGQIDQPGEIEGGDCCWLDPTTLAVGRGYRTNDAGIAQLRVLLEPLGLAVEVYDLPYHEGPDSCLHLLSLVSPLADDLALVYAPMLPVALYRRLEAMGYTLLHAPEDEFRTSHGLSLNVLATAPHDVIAIDGFPATAALLRENGCTVTTVPGRHLAIPCEGGPTCLTRPLHRSE